MSRRYGNCIEHLMGQVAIRQLHCDGREATNASTINRLQTQTAMRRPSSKTSKPLRRIDLAIGLYDSQVNIEDAVKYSR